MTEKLVAVFWPAETKRAPITLLGTASNGFGRSRPTVSLTGRSLPFIHNQTPPFRSVVVVYRLHARRAVVAIDSGIRQLVTLDGRIVGSNEAMGEILLLNERRALKSRRGS